MTQITFEELRNLAFEELWPAYLKYWMQLAPIEWQLKLLEKEEKSILAREATNSDGTSEAERTRIWYNSKAYKTWREGIQEVTEQRARLRSILHAIDMTFETKRSLNALRNAEMKLQ